MVSALFISHKKRYEKQNRQFVSFKFLDKSMLAFPFSIDVISFQDCYSVVTSTNLRPMFIQGPRDLYTINMIKIIKTAYSSQYRVRFSLRIKNECEEL